MRRSQACLAAIFALVLVFAAAAQGEMITFAFSGTITSVSQSSAKPIGDAVKVDDVYHGTYSFDPLTPDSDARSDYGDYNSPEASLIITLGALTLEIPGPNMFIHVVNGSPYDAYSVGGLGFASAGLSIPEFSFGVFFDNSAFNTEALPLVPPAQDLFVTGQLHFGGSKAGDGTFDIRGTFESLVLVPEPGAVFLAASGLALAVRRFPTR